MKRNLKIDEEFHSLIRPLSRNEYAQLEQSIKREGCRDPLVLWEGKNILLDGYHRYKICRKNNIKFKTTELSLPNREIAKAWIIQNQSARRNSNAFQLCEMALQSEPFLKKEAKKQQGKRTDILFLKIKSLDTQARLAKIANVSKSTIYKAKFIKKECDSENILQELRKGNLTINTVYNDLKLEERIEKIKKIKRKYPFFPKDAPSIWYDIMDVTGGKGIRPFIEDGKVVEYEEYQGNVPIQLRRRKGFPPDEVANMLGLEDHQDLYERLSFKRGTESEIPNHIQEQEEEKLRMKRAKTRIRLSEETQSTKKAIDEVTDFLKRIRKYQKHAGRRRVEKIFKKHRLLISIDRLVDGIVYFMDIYKPKKLSKNSQN